MNEQTEFLTKLIQTNSENGNEAAISALIAAKLQEHGISSKLLPYSDGRSNIIAELNPDAPGKTLALSGHQDTVLIGDRAKWHHDPFAAEIKDGVLYGRGAADMKSGLAAMVFALIELHDTHFAGHVRFMATVGEEYGAMGARQLTKAGYADDIDGLVIGEPTLPNIIHAHSGSFNYKIIARGQSAHSSMPELGVNALSLLTDFMIAERTAFDDAPADPVLGKLVHSVTIAKVGSQVNTIPDYGEVAGNIRPVPTFDNEHVIERLKEVCAQLNAKSKGTLTFELTHSFRPVSTPADADIVQALQAAITKQNGQPAPLDIIHGATDASEFTLANKQLPTLIYGPGAWDQAHMIDEHVALSDFENAIKVYADLAREFCK
ncbi:MAG: ArgE/DapE family deacylase [Lacticaseibacillus songhuajiangensis]|jgi:succinyl-diaminopimelate desuccinylase|nr:ArgE/DapE family deacylase [Lacticaseibacillus songhuajiangensis]